MTDAELLKKEEIDSDKNDKIDVQEMENFLDSEDNIKKLWESMDSNISPELLQELESALKDLCEKLLSQPELSENQQKIINYFFNKLWNKYPELNKKIELYTTINQCINSNDIIPKDILNNPNRKEQIKNTIQHINKINKWNKEFWSNNPNKKEQLKNIIQNQVNKVSKIINEEFWKNIKWNPYEANQIAIIQLRANVNFWEDLQIDGMRWAIWYWNLWKWENQRITNLYIYRQELITRQWVIDYRKEHNMKNIREHLLKIPNLNSLLWALETKEQQNKVFEKFLNFFFEIKRSWPFFENQIWEIFWDSWFQCVLFDLINAELYKDIPLKPREWEKIPRNITTEWKYYEEKANALMKDMLKQNQSIVDYNKQLIAIQEQKKDMETYNQILEITNKIKNLPESGIGKNNLFIDALKVSEKIKDSNIKGIARKEIFILMKSEYNDTAILGNWKNAIQEYFGQDIWLEYNSVIKWILEKASKWDTEEITDMLSQLDNINVIKLPMNSMNRQDIYNIYNVKWQRWFTDSVLLYGLSNTNYFSFSPIEKKQPYTEYVHKMLNIPWIAEPVRVSFDKKNQTIIEDAMIQANKWEIKLVLPWFQIWKNKLPEWMFGASAQTLISPNDFSIVKELGNWDIQLYKLWEKTPYRTIKKEEQIQARMIESDAMRITAWSREFKEDIDKLKWLSWSMQAIQKLADKMNAEHYADRLTDEDEEKIFKDSINLASELKKLRDVEQRSHSISHLRDELIRLKNSRDWKSLKTDQEKQLDDYIKQLTLLSNWLKPNSDVDKFISYMTNSKNIHSNDTFWEDAKNWLKDNLITIVCAIGIAVALVLAIPSWWTSLLAAWWLTSLLTTAAVMTAGWMIWQRVWQYINEQIRDSTTFWTFVEIDGKKVQIHYDDPTDIERVINWDIAVWDFLTGIWLEFLIGTATTMWFMYAWKCIWSKISNYILENPTSKMTTFLKKIPKPFNKLWDVKDPYTEDIFSNIAKNWWKNFPKKWASEFWEEMCEEWIENGADLAANKIWDNINLWFTNVSILWAIVTTWNSLTPRWNPKIYKNNKVKLDSFHPGPWKSIITELSYDANIPDAKQNLIDHFIELWFTPNPDWTLSKGNEVNNEFTDVIKLQESKLPENIRAISSNLSEFWIFLDHESDGEAYYTNAEELNRFQKDVQKNRKWIVKINEDGTATFITDKISLTIKPSIENEHWSEIDTSETSKTIDTPNLTGKIQSMKENDINDLIEWKSETKLEELSANDLRLLMFKACNMWLDFLTIEKLWVAIEHSIIDNPNISTDTRTELRDYVNKLCYMTEIKNVNINEDPSRIEKALDEIQQQIDIKFWEDSITAKELSIETNKKKFELYKKNWNIEQAQNIVNQIREQNTELLSDDTTNFRYRRWILESNLLQIQLWWKNWTESIEWLNRDAQEVREKTETIWWRTDTETLISKIEAWILLWKTNEELQPYLDMLALSEHWAWINILWAVIQTVDSTFKTEEAKWILDNYAKNVKEAWDASKNTNLLKAWEKATEIAETYNKMKNGLETDKNGETKTEIENRLTKFTKTKNVTSISDVWNNFSHFTVLLNPWAAKNSPVMSIEIWKVDYETAYNTLKAEFQKEWIDIEWDIWDYNTFIWKFNKVVDNWIRTNFWTEKLQELNSSEHRALFDYIAAKFMESRRWSADASLTNLSQLLDIKWVQDCRLHAFTKQLFFDSRKINKLNSLEKSKTWDPKKDAEINKQIKIIENTKMIFMDAEFSWNVDMNAKYVSRTEDWHMEAWNQNNIIEEHTFNLIEMPVLDESWNIQYDKDWNIKKKVCFADSFYQWSIEEWFDTGKVYNLSYTWEDISGTIYWKKWEDVYMTTKVTDVNWNEIEIKVKPLTRSMKWRWDNITWSSIETRWPSTEEATRLNNQYEEWLETVEILRRNRAEIKENFQNILTSLESWQPISSDAVEKALTSSDWHKVAEWQANQIKRAFELLWKVPESKKWEALTAIQTMINNTVTQNVIDFTWAKGDATEFLQTEWVFFKAMQIFNDVYKSEIEEATKQLDPSNPESVKRLQEAINEYQKIFDTDMNDFFKRFHDQIERELKMKKEEWWNIDGYQVYDRNNFEQIAKRFQDNMKVYAEAVKGLGNAWKFREAYVIKKYMVDQGNTLLNHSDELLWHMIDFKKVKKEMKGLKWREIYNQLKEIQGNRNLEEEFKKSWLDWNYIKEMTWMDKDAPLNKDNLDMAIKNIEESWLKKYYDTIELVFNPELLAINIENTVYSNNPVYTSESESWRIFTTETEEEYIARKERESKVEKNIDNNTQSEEIQKICDWIVDTAIQKISNWNEASQIKTTISELIRYCKINWIKWKAMYDLCKISTEALIFQTTESKTRSMGDHWINHISWNIQKLNTYLEAWVKAWKIPAGEVWKYKLMWALTHIFHDIWYAAIISRWSNSFDGSAIHPFTSKMFFDANIKNILENAKINTELIGKAIESHDGIRLNWGSPEATFLSMVNLSDNMALWVDKIAEIWSNPHLLKHISTLYALDASWLDIKKTHEVMVDEINKDPNLNENQKETLKSAIQEISTFSMGNVDFRSISPLTSMAFNWKAPTLSMFQWANIMLVAEVCGINKAELEQAIKNKDRDAIIKIMEWPDWKWTKFLSQIIKPLWDYCDIYTIHDAKWNEYEKVDWKYNRNNIKADLLLGETLTLKDWNSEVLNYRYEWSTNESILAEQNSVYGSINMKEMLWEWVEARDKLQANKIIKYLWKVNSQIDNISKKIEKNERISSELSELSETITGIWETLTSWDASSNEPINKKYQELVDNLKELQDYTKNGDYDYKELTPKIKEIQTNINELLPIFIAQ